MFKVPEITTLIEEDRPFGNRLSTVSSLEIVQTYEAINLGRIGAFWAALAAIEAPPNKPRTGQASRSPPQTRLRTAKTSGKSLATSTSASSSSSSRASSASAPASSQASDASYIDRGEHQRHVVPEDATVQLASIFIDHVLMNLPSQRFVNANGTRLAEVPDVVVEFTNIRTERTVLLANGETVHATGDGELYARKNLGSGYEFCTDRPVILLEAKRREAHIDADEKAQIGDELLGQMVAEAIAVRQEAKSPGSPVVYIIYAVQKYLRVLRFKISTTHLEAIVSGTPSDGFIEVIATQSFNLTTPSGRRRAVEAIVLLAQIMKAV